MNNLFSRLSFLLLSLTLGLENGNSLEIADADEYFAFLMDEEGEFELLYPFFLQNLIDDSVMEVTSDEDFIAALEDCGIEIVKRLFVGTF